MTIEALKFHYLVVSASISVATFLLAAFIFAKGRSKNLSRVYSAWALCVGLWSFFLFFNIIAKTQGQALFLCRLLHVWAIILPAVYVHFVLLFLNKFEKNKVLVYFLYSLAFLLTILNFTPWFLTATYRDKFGFFITKPLKLYLIHFIMFLGCINYVYFELFRSVIAEKGARKRQILYFLIATLSAYSGGITNYLINYDIFLFPIYPFANYGVMIYVFIVGLLIVRHRFLDIEVIIKKTLVFAGLFAMIMAVVTAVTTVTQNYVSKYLLISPTISTLLSVVIAVFLYEPVRTLLVNATDKFLFQKRLDFKVILNRLSNDIITILDIDKAGSKILSTIKTTLRLEAGVIYVKDENEDDYRVLEAFGLKEMPRRILKDDLFLRFMFETKNMINLEDQDQITSWPTEVTQFMDSCGAVIAIPLFIHTDLIGILMLGKKQSDQEFTPDEIGYFPTVAGQVAISLSNARLYDLLKKSQIDFAQQAKMAAIGTLSAGISHEIKNPLNHIKVGISMLRMNKKHGVLDQLERYQLEEEIFKTLEILDENVMRANEVIERLSSFAKKPKELKIEPVNLEKAVDMALSFVKNEYDHHQIEVVKDFPEHLPLVNADLHTFEDVFLNLLVNARHAIEDHGKVTITAKIDQAILDLSIKDTGKGISKENLANIWDPFFTTKDVSRNPDEGAVKGSGLGLFIVREFIQRFGGNITVESELGRGTTFHVVFPESVWVK